MDQTTLFYLVLACSIGGVFSTYCYECNSYSDDDHTACIDPMSPYPAVNYTLCSGSYVCTRVSYVTQKQFVVSRNCDLSGDTCNNIYNTLSLYYPDLSTFNCYFCSGDYCNDVSGSAYSSELKTIEMLQANGTVDKGAPVVNRV